LRHKNQGGRLGPLRRPSLRGIGALKVHLHLAIRLLIGGSPSRLLENRCGICPVRPCDETCTVSAAAKRRRPVQHSEQAPVPITQVKREVLTMTYDE
jgi:hypothetical protein